MSIQGSCLLKHCPIQYSNRRSGSC